MIKTLHITNPLNDKIDDYISKYVVSKLALKQDYNKSPINYILVEGWLDKKFFKRLNKEESNNEFIVVDKETFSELGKKNNNFDSKISILNTMVITNLEYLKNKNIYGIVDKDFDDGYPTLRNNRVASDTAHDLEMMLVSTDDNLLKSIFPFSTDKFNVSMYMAYQLAVIKYGVSNMRGHPSYSTKRFSDFTNFFDKDKLNIKKFINFINNRNSNPEKHLKHAELIEKLKSQKKIDKNEEFKITYDQFVKHLPNDFYSMVNGHDLRNCFIINYGEMYGMGNILNQVDNIKEDEIISKVDNQLVYNYQTSNFVKSNLYLKLQKFNLNL